jgi:hypothetical protein
MCICSTWPISHKRIFSPISWSIWIKIIVGNLRGASGIVQRGINTSPARVPWRSLVFVWPWRLRNRWTVAASESPVMTRERSRGEGCKSWQCRMLDLTNPWSWSLGFERSHDASVAAKGTAEGLHLGRYRLRRVVRSSSRVDVGVVRRRPGWLVCR